jgi:hypothetical protein
MMETSREARPSPTVSLLVAVWVQRGGWRFSVCAIWLAWNVLLTWLPAAWEPAAADAAGGSSSGAGGSGSSSAAAAAAAAEPAGMRMYLSQIREWVVDFGADMLFISIRTDVAW